MNTYLVLARQPEADQPALPTIICAFAPFLGTFGVVAEIVGIEELSNTKPTADTARATLIRVTLAGTPNTDPQTLASKMRANLNDLAENAKVAAKFDIYHLESTATQSATIT
jgi:hypothetical protein